MLLSFMLFTSTCKNDDVIIIEGGCLADYFLYNNTSVELIIISQIPENKGDTILIPQQEKKRYARIAGFNSLGEPWQESPYLEIYKKETDSVLLVYQEILLSDSLWDSEEVDVGSEPYCLWHYTIEITDSMLLK